MDIIIPAFLLGTLLVAAVRAARTPERAPAKREPDDFDALVEHEQVRAIYAGVRRGA